MSQPLVRKFNYTTDQITRLRSTISEERFYRYLTIAEGDPVKAVRRYEHNTALSESLYGVLQGFEITLRNAIHGTMVLAIGRDDWFDHLNLEGPETESIFAAKAKIQKKNKTITSARVVAELTFGFWVSLSGRNYSARLWLPHLHKAFPHTPLGHKKAFTRFTAIRLLRNMIAHHECILHRDLAQDYRDVIESAAWICPDTANWIRETTRFEACYRILFRKEAIPLPLVAAVEGTQASHEA